MGGGRKVPNEKGENRRVPSSSQAHAKILLTPFPAPRLVGKPAPATGRMVRRPIVGIRKKWHVEDKGDPIPPKVKKVSQDTVTRKKRSAASALLNYKQAAPPLIASSGKQILGFLFSSFFFFVRRCMKLVD
jgi:hypothetical protein